MAVSEAPAGQVFDSWYYSTDYEIYRRSSDSILRLPVTTRYIEVYPEFKDISSVVYVDGENGDDTNGNGTNTDGKQFKTIAKALTAILESSDNIRRGFCIDVKNYGNGDYEKINIDNRYDGRAKHITIDLNADCNLNTDYNSNTDYNKIGCIDVNTSVPVIVKNGIISPVVQPEGSLAAIRLEGKQLTLDNVMCISGEGTEMRGAEVITGELVLTKSQIASFSGENGGGAIVYRGGKLSLKQESYIADNEASTRGGGVYLSDGAIMSIKDNSVVTGNFSGNKNGNGVYMVDGSTLIVSGGRINANGDASDSNHSDVYVENSEDGVNFIIEKAPFMEYVELAPGACVKVNTKEFLAGGYEDFIEVPYVGFCTIDPDAVAVKLDNDNITEEQKDQIFGIFKVDNENLLASGYSPEIGLDGKPFKTQKLYATGKITIKSEIQEWNVEDIITYIYYHGEGDNEYLCLQHGFNNADYEYRRFWLVGDKIYCDNAYMFSGSEWRPLKNSDYKILSVEDSPTYSWQTNWDENVITRSSDCYNMLQIDANALNGYYTPVEREGYLYFNDAGNNTVAVLTNGIAREIHDTEIFQNHFSGLKKLLSRAVIFEGVGNDINSLTEINWSSLSDGYILSFGNEVKESDINEGLLFNHSVDHLYEIEQMFKNLRYGNDINH